jgi:molecular chaperone GrpE (heat shock protein)
MQQMSLLKSGGIDPTTLKLIEAIKDMRPATGALTDPRAALFANISELLSGSGVPTGTPTPQLESPRENNTSSPDTVVIQPVVTENPSAEKFLSPDCESLPSHKEENTIMQQILTEMQDLRQDFETKLKYDDGKQKTIDTLHKELEEHRTGLHFKILRPVFLDLIRLYDDLEKMIESMSPQPEQSLNRTLEDLQLLQGEVVEILERYGAEAFSLDGPLQANKQRVIKTIETTDSTLDKRIARRLRKGFSYENRILRPEQVVVYKFVGN